MTASRDSLQFKTNAVPGQNGATWRWTPSDGFINSDPVVYRVDSDKGWSDLRSRTIGHPSELFFYGEIARQLVELLGVDRIAFQAILSGVGSGEFKGNNYFGSACTPHMCGTEEGMVFLDALSKRAYIAWKPN
ncbi:hypothetical protein [Kaistia soli]|uniref:hypothetical protein n=1 Tax=Kaistia soli TaxID=446684 RepID=UPI000932551A|nr:hypothetical protein [Kaistia soli]